MDQEGRPPPSDLPLESGSGDSSDHQGDRIRDDLIGFGVNAALVEEIRCRYEVDRGSVDSSWASLFEPEPESSEIPTASARPLSATGSQAGAGAEIPIPRAEQHARVLRLIHAFRARGHRAADTDPLGKRSDDFPELDPAHYGFGDEDLDRPYLAGDLPGGEVQPLGQILARLRATYCGTIGIEFTHVQDPGRRVWLQSQMEEARNRPQLDSAERLSIREKIAAADGFERFLHTKFIGQKRFSLEGAESLIPLLDTMVEGAPGYGIVELVIGMTHRGRLNVLSNILGKSLESIFSEFEDNPLINSPFGSGDVKYHKGYSNDREVKTGERVHLSLTANPSHLEAVGPVVEGRVRAKQRRAGDLDGRAIVPILIHGDAAFAGQGIVAETLNLAGLVGYTTGGTIHVIVNNQIGFTTSPASARSTLYATDVAKMIQIPIFHVNGDDPEAVVHCAKLAMDYRQRFGEDAVIDLVCYRRHGHNEGDEPSFTQPLMYQKIRNTDPVRKIYTEKLIDLGVLSRADVDRIDADLQAQLQCALTVIRSRSPGPDEPYEPGGPWTGLSRTAPEVEPETGVPIERLAQLAEQISSLPPDFPAHPKLIALLEKRRKMIAEDRPIDWGMAEALAFASLLVEGTPVRLSGQDSARGTFSHRHASIVSQKTGEEYIPLSHLSSSQARFEVYDSMLSEAAVLGFEYGYTLADPTTLTIWEAQFGDFVNGAQVIIDQFICSAHVKWQRMSGLVMLLPHGFEGQGPDHSSARVERFLQACADDNLQVVNCTTPAQYFHVLRRQMRRSYRVPLIVFSPKSLLRMPQATSRVEDLASGGFQPVLGDPLAAASPEAVRRVVFCSGKLYYELLAERERRHAGAAGPVALIRIEQLYPWPKSEIRSCFESFPRAARIVWAQEEPANMGAWTFVRERLSALAGSKRKLTYAGRPASASPAVGSMRVHKAEQSTLISRALAEGD
ncbi:MAG: 2-oxoglutarate dehydrogenase E1 component [Myxococcota bacterium]